MDLRKMKKARERETRKAAAEQAEIVEAMYKAALTRGEIAAERERVAAERDAALTGQGGGDRRTRPDRDLAGPGSGGARLDRELPRPGRRGTRYAAIRPSTGQRCRRGG